MFAFSRKLSRRISKTFVQRDVLNKDDDLDNLDLPTARYHPDGLEALCRNTKFSRRELQIMYSGFKQKCPSGYVNEEKFKAIYGLFFPPGGSSTYAHYVFHSFDLNGNGAISFKEFVTGLSILARGSFHEKLLWAFRLYDIDGDGFISRDEMHEIVSAVQDMMGTFATPVVCENTTRKHVEMLFKKMDLNQDGVISADEFMHTCAQDGDIYRSMAVFDTVL